MKKKEQETYSDKLENQFAGIGKSFDRAPFVMLVADAVCAIIYAIVYGTAEECGAELVAYIAGGMLTLSCLFAVIYILSVLIKRTQNTFPLAFSSIFTTILVCWNLMIILQAWDELFDFLEWIPVLIFMVLSLGWFVFTVIRIRKEMRGEKVKEISIPYGVIMFVIISLTPILFYSGRKGIGDWLPYNFFIYYMAYATFLVNVVATRFVLDANLFCMKRLFKGK